MVTKPKTTESKPTRISLPRVVKDPKRKAKLLAKELAVEKKRVVKSVTRKTPRFKNRPPYLSMIKRALAKTKDERTTFKNIAKFIEANYPLPENYNRYLRSALKRGRDSGFLSHSTMGYKLTNKFQTRSKSRKSKKPRRPIIEEKEVTLSRKTKRSETKETKETTKRIKKAKRGTDDKSERKSKSKGTEKSERKSKRTEKSSKKSVRKPRDKETEKRRSKKRLLKYRDQSMIIFGNIIMMAGRIMKWLHLMK